MAATKIADVIVPDVFNPYVVQRTAELTALFLGGIISTNADLDTLATAGGKLIQMPFFSDLTGADEVLSDSAALTPDKIGSGKDQATLLMRGKSWGVNDLAKALSGDDPMRAVADLVAGIWFRRSQTTLINSLDGVLADNVANDAGDMVVDVAVEVIGSQTAATRISAANVIAASTTMGDAAGRLTAIAMHSAIFQGLQNQEVIVYERPAGSDINFPTYLGLRVIVDDGLPKVAGTTSGFKYTCVLFGEGAIGLGNGEAPVPVETDRDSLLGEDYLINRRHFLFHPRGIAFQAASVAGASATNAELALAANWSRVYERKNVRIAYLIVNDG